MSFLVTHDKVVGTLHMQLWTRLAAMGIVRSYGCCCHQLWPLGVRAPIFWYGASGASIFGDNGVAAAARSRLRLWLRGRGRSCGFWFK